MRKKALCVVMTTAMVASMFTACGSSDKGGSSSGTGTVSGSDGKVLNISCWNDEFKSRITDHYPGYEKVSETEGKIGDVTVKWNITANENNAYQNKLDEDLLKQKDAAADDKIDIFLVEADYALKYVDTEYTVAIKDLGITDADIADQYKYTQDVVTDSNGNVKGLSWQGCPGVLFYNREAAKEILGSDDAETVQAAVKDWDTFNETAKLAVEKGYMMTSTVNDTYRVYQNNVTSKWVVDGKVNIDDNIKKWVDDSKELVDMGATQTAGLWSDEWKIGFFPEGKTFCYFGPAWLVNFSMAADTAGSIANIGGWGATEGPQGFFWGGTWICAATGTDNADLIKDIMLKMTCDASIMKGIVEKDDDFANNKTAMAEMAASDYESKVLGGQNPLQMYMNGVATLDLSNLTEYDQACNEKFQGAMKDYFDGNCTYDEAIEKFNKDIVVAYPALKTE